MEGRRRREKRKKKKKRKRKKRMPSALEGSRPLGLFLPLATAAAKSLTQLRTRTALRWEVHLYRVILYPLPTPPPLGRHLIAESRISVARFLLRALAVVYFFQHPRIQCNRTNQTLPRLLLLFFLSTVCAHGAPSRICIFMVRPGRSECYSTMSWTGLGNAAKSCLYGKAVGEVHTLVIKPDQ